MFGRATITLGIGPHSSLLYFFPEVAQNFENSISFSGSENFRLFQISSFFQVCGHHGILIFNHNLLHSGITSVDFNHNFLLSETPL